MTVQFLAQNILTDAHFLRAEDATGAAAANAQASPHWGQPEPDAADSGRFRLLCQGTPEDFEYQGETTATGSTTTVICSTLSKVYGDDFFIGATVTLDLGGGDESRTVTDFDQASGTLTVGSAFSGTVGVGVSFTLALTFADRDIQVELVASGDAGDATFKWTHDGGTTWFGRATSWTSGHPVYNDVASERMAICQAADGTLIAAYRDGTDSKPYCVRSSDRGLTWGSPILMYESIWKPQAMLTLASGRILAFLNTRMVYSDDHGLTWSFGTETVLDGSWRNLYGVTELSSGVLFGGCLDSSNNLDGALSSNGGFTWVKLDNIASATCGSGQGCVQAANGDLVIVYAYLDGGNSEIRAKISENNGVTWGDAITVLDYSGVKYYTPNAVRDIDGRLWAFAYYDDTDQTIVCAYSDDNGATWTSGGTIASSAGIDFRYPNVCLMDGRMIAYVYADVTNGDLYMGWRGVWETYSSNACPAAINAIPQRLICGSDIVWQGAAGIAGDAWTISPEYQFSMAHLIADSPSRPWRTVDDAADYAVVIDLGANARMFADGCAFFGTNVRGIKFQMNATDSWGSPSVDEAVDFTIDDSGEVDSVSGNAVVDAALLAGYADHELRGKYLRMTSGTDDTLTWAILDNVGDYIFLDTEDATNIAGDDTFEIFGTKAAATFTAGVYRFCRILIETQNTAEGFYQVGYAALGRMVTIDNRGIRAGLSLTRRSGVDLLTTVSGGLIPVSQHGPKNVWEIAVGNAGWETGVADNTARAQLLSLLDLTRGGNIVLIPDSADLLDVHLVKSTADAQQTHRYLDRYDVALTLEEVL